MGKLVFKLKGVKSSINSATEKSNIRSNQNIVYGSLSHLDKSGVYEISCDKSSKVYIGSSKNVQLRCLKHFSELRLNRHRCKELQKDYNQFGYDSFKVRIIEETNEFLLEKEKQHQIDKTIDLLYNEKISGFYINEELKNIYASTDKSTHKTEAYRNKMSKLKTNKVAQFTLDGEYIKTFNSAIEICEEFGYTRSVILSACNGSKRQAYGYKWRYVDDENNIKFDGYDKARIRQN